MVARMALGVQLEIYVDDENIDPWFTTSSCNKYALQVNLWNENERCIWFRIRGL
jgi:hypothetical protein